jgi:hypothetical protein
VHSLVNNEILLPVKWCLILLLVLQTTLAEAAQKQLCSSCGIQTAENIYAVRGLNNGAKRWICYDCIVSVAHCNICRLPVSVTAYKRLEDGRFFCLEDYQNGIFDAAEVERILYETRRELDRIMWKYMNFPQTNIEITVIDGRKLYKAADIQYNPYSVTIGGLTKTKYFGPDGKEIEAKDRKKMKDSDPVTFKHQVHLLSGLPKQRLMAVCAHEYTHVWLHEHLRPSRDLDRDTVEGFCELVAYQLMDAMNEDFEKQVIEANAYTTGQAVTLLETEKQYGFYRILQWMQDGVDSRINWTDLDRIRAIEPTTAAATPPPVKTFTFAAVPVLPGPLTLELKSISTIGKRKLVLINNQTLELSEKASVHLGATNVSVRCLEIREKSVLVEINGTEQREIFLTGAR